MVYYRPMNSVMEPAMQAHHPLEYHAIALSLAYCVIALWVIA